MTEEEKKAKKARDDYAFKMNKPAKEFYIIIEPHLETITDDLFPLQYEKQKRAIHYIMNELRGGKFPLSIRGLDGLVEVQKEIEKSKKDFENFLKSPVKQLQEVYTPQELKEIYILSAKQIEIKILEKINNNIQILESFKFDAEQNYEDSLNKIKFIEEQGKASLEFNYNKDLTDNKDAIIARREYNNKLKELKREITAEHTKAKEQYLKNKYAIKLQASKTEEEGQKLVTEYKTEIKKLNDQTIQNLNNQELDLRTGNPIENVEDHPLVTLGILTKEEMAPILSSYALLNTLLSYNAYGNVAKLFNIARNFYPDNPAKGIAELAEISHEKATYLLNGSILNLLHNKIIDFTYIQSLENSELSKIINLNDCDAHIIKKLVDAGFTIKTLIDLPESNLKLFLSYFNFIIESVYEQFTIENLINLEEYKLNLLAQKAGLNIKEFISLRESNRDLFINKLFEIPGLIKANLIDKLISFAASKQNLFFSYYLKNFVEPGIVVEKLLSLDEEEYITTNADPIQNNEIDLTGAPVEDINYI